MILRGIFLCRKKELDWLYGGSGANFIFPEDWESYEAAIPEKERNDFIKAYHRRLTGEFGDKEMIRAAKGTFHFAFLSSCSSFLTFFCSFGLSAFLWFPFLSPSLCLAWSLWEGRSLKLVQDPIESLMSFFGDDHYACAFARIENHYFMNNAFFPRDGYLLEKQNMSKIAHIPTVIVQGRYDIVCPPISAHDLHKALPTSEVHYVIAGHSVFEDEIVKKLIETTERFKNK
jgi:proline iminopeptidase